MSCRLLVNLVTSVTLGLALAAKLAEPDVLDRPPLACCAGLILRLLVNLATSITLGLALAVWS